MTDTSCLLFFPGTRPELLTKAAASGAGLACLDLEDAVAPESKEAARASAVQLTETHGGPPRLVVRINHPSTPHGRLDLEALAEVDDAGEITLMLPKASGARDVERVARALGGQHGNGDDGRAVSIIPVVETARGLAAVQEIASAEGVGAIMFGGLDLSVELGCALAWEPLLYARSRCVLAARLAGVELIDTPFFDLEDPDGLRAEAERARGLGFTAKAAIHPRQVETIRAAFAPTVDEIDGARRVVEAAEREGAGVFLLDGRMIDRPVVDAARRLLARIEAGQR